MYTVFAEQLIKPHLIYGTTTYIRLSNKTKHSYILILI